MANFYDLSETRQENFRRTQEFLEVGDDWAYRAFMKKPLENWEKYGFNLWRNTEFKSEVDALLEMAPPTAQEVEEFFKRASAFTIVEPANYAQAYCTSENWDDPNYIGWTTSPVLVKTAEDNEYYKKGIEEGRFRFISRVRKPHAEKFLSIGWDNLTIPQKEYLVHAIQVYNVVYISRESLDEPLMNHTRRHTKMAEFNFDF